MGFKLRRVGDSGWMTVDGMSAQHAAKHHASLYWMPGDDDVIEYDVIDPGNVEWAVTVEVIAEPHFEASGYRKKALSEEPAR